MSVVGEQAELGAIDAELRRREVADVDARTTGAVELLVRALGDEDWRVRKEAVRATGRHGPSDALLDSLVELLSTGATVGQRNAAVEALARLGDGAVQRLARELPRLDADARKLALEALAGTARVGALDVMAPLLDDTDANVRVAAIEAVSAVGEAALERVAYLLERCLLRVEAIEVLAALEGLNRLGARAPWSHLVAWLAHPITRWPALAVAARTGAPELAAHLVEALREARASRWEGALSACAEYLETGPGALRAGQEALAGLEPDLCARILERARSDVADDPARPCAVLLLAGLASDAAVHAAFDALSDDRVAAEAERALLLLGPRALATLVERASRGHESEQAVALELLGALGEQDPSLPVADAVSAIAEELSMAPPGEAAPGVLTAAIAALGRLGDLRALALARRALHAGLRSALQREVLGTVADVARLHPDAARQLAHQAHGEAQGADTALVVAVLGALDGPVLGSVEADRELLRAALRDQHATVRRLALEVLPRHPGWVGPEELRFVLNDEQLEVRLAAVRALGLLRDADGGSPGVAELIELSRSADDELISSVALEALGTTAAPAALAHLSAVVRDCSAALGVVAVQAIGALDVAGQAEVLGDLLAHSAVEIVKAALGALRESGEAADAGLEACLRHPAWDVRRLAADLVARRGGVDALRAIRQRLAVEEEPLVLEALRRGLAHLEGRAPRHTVGPSSGEVTQ